MVSERQQQAAGKVAAFNLAEAGFGDRSDLDDDGRERRTDDYGASAMSSAMSTPGSGATAAGLTVMLISVSTGMHVGAGGFGLLLCFMGVLVGASLVAAGVRMADGPAPIVSVVSGGARAHAAFVRHNTAAVGLVMASCAVTAVSGEEDPVLCFTTFALVLLAVSLINIGARGE